MNLQQQIEQLKANPNVGGVVWEIVKGYSNTFTTSNEHIRIDVEFLKNKATACVWYDKGKDSWRLYTLKSTTLNEALIEALGIVKNKVKELAKELGLVCLDKEEAKIITTMYGYTSGNYSALKTKIQQYLMEQGDE